MKKLMYVLSLSVLSGVLLSCKDDVVNPANEPDVEIPSTENETDGSDEYENGGVKPSN